MKTPQDKDQLSGVLRKAIEVFGDEESARQWMQKPVRHFEGKTPLEVLDTEEGMRLVEEVLIQIEEGMFT